MKKSLILIFFLGLLLIFFLLKNGTSDLVKITLKGKQTQATYFVELADTHEKATQGLMERKSMPQDHGMLFIFPYPSLIKMWMKNTYLPLDMIFFNAHNQVICLHENAKPLDESIISCPWPAQKVLELNAGQIRAHHIQLGDILTEGF